jgi:hypothetical protein
MHRHLVANIVAGDGIEVDESDPHNPVVSATGGGGGGIASVEAGTNIMIDTTDPAHPIVSFGGDEAPYISIVPEAPGMIVLLDPATYLQIFGGVFTFSTAGHTGGPFNIGDDSPWPLPRNADVVGNLNPVGAMRGHIVYDLLTESVMYSNGTIWVAI